MYNLSMVLLMYIFSLKVHSQYTSVKVQPGPCDWSNWYTKILQPKGTFDIVLIE